MASDPEYIHVLEHLYEKSLILHDESLWHPVIYFYFMDALAHLDYTIALMAYHYKSPRVMMSGEYLRWRIDEEKKGDQAKFPGFIDWLKLHDPGHSDSLPLLWKRIYDSEDRASYRSFRIVFDPESREPIRPHVFYNMIEDFFKADFLKSLYEDASLPLRFEEYKRSA